MKSRIILVFIGLCFFWVVLLLRGAQLQIIPNSQLTALKAKQFQTEITLQGRRGAIVDRQGRDLALSSASYSLFADPKLITGKKQIAKKLAKEFGTSVETMFTKLKDPTRRFVWITRFMPKLRIEKIMAWKVKGLSSIQENKRIYPNENLLSQVLGMVGSEGQGLEGIELSYDEKLNGEVKRLAARRDARGRPLLINGMFVQESSDGSDLQLTIDSEIQHVMESELLRAIHEHDATQAFGIVMEASTSAILALGTVPTYDVNNALKLKPGIRRNKTITDLFEPGSTMKTFALAGALSLGLVHPNTKFNTENGQFKIGKRIIREAELDHKWPQLTVSEILALSSNIGTSKIALQMGPENLKKILEDFGFGQKTNIDLPGEQRGVVLPLPWNQHLLSNISFGQGISATPLQVANAYAAIANGGILNRPYIVKKIHNWEKNEETEFDSRPIRRVISNEISAQLRMMLTEATSDSGTGAKARVDGYLVGGKTGTAQKVDPNGKGYLAGAYLSSFVGFVPASDPKFVIYIAVDEPKKNSYYGSQVAAPVFSRIASFIARKQGIVPEVISEKNLIPKRQTEQQLILSQFKKQSLKSAQEDQAHAEQGLTEEQIAKVMPDLKSMTMREVMRKFKGSEHDIKFQGTGVVAETIPAFGESLSAQQKIWVNLKSQKE